MPVQRAQQIVNHDPFRADKEQSRAHCRKQGSRRKPAHCLSDLPHILPVKNGIERQRHDKQEKSPFQDSFPIACNPFFPCFLRPVMTSFHRPPPFLTLRRRTIRAVTAPYPYPAPLLPSPAAFPLLSRTPAGFPQKSPFYPDTDKSPSA